MAKSQQKYTCNVAGSVVAFTFADASKTKVTVDYAKLTDAIKTQAGIHGIKQKLGDSTAGKGLADSLTNMRRVAHALVNGNWEVSSVNIEDLMQAVVKVTGKPEAEVRKIVESAGEDKIKSWAGTPAIQAEMLDIQAKRAKAYAKEQKPETDALADFK